MNLDEAVAFIDKSKYKFTDTHSRCVDGRYDPEEELPAMAKPGADEGDLATAFAACNKLGIDCQKDTILNAVLETVGGVSNFHFHTDQRTEEDCHIPGMGCGHAKFENQDATAYGLTPEQGKYIFDTLNQLLKQGAKQTVLKGNHEEQAVFTVTSNSYSLKPHIFEPISKEAFIYHKTLTEKRLHDLTHNLLHWLNLPEAKEQSLYETILECHNNQLQETVNRLAANLPHYNVEINDDGTALIKAA